MWGAGSGARAGSAKLRHVGDRPGQVPARPHKPRPFPVTDDLHEVIHPRPGRRTHRRGGRLGADRRVVQRVGAPDRQPGRPAQPRGGRRPGRRPRVGLAALDDSSPSSSSRGYPMLRHAAVAAYLHESDGDLATAARLYAEAAHKAPGLAERDHLTRQAPGSTLACQGCSPARGDAAWPGRRVLRPPRSGRPVRPGPRRRPPRWRRPPSVFSCASCEASAARPPRGGVRPETCDGSRRRGGKGARACHRGTGSPGPVRPCDRVSAKK